jgi:FlaA1/EpsC-like NDP-sugar epimerase
VHLPRASRSSLGRYGWGVVDAVVWFLAVVAATWMRHEYDVDATFTVNTLASAAGAAAAHVVLGVAIGPYRRHVVRGTFDEVRDLAVTDGIVTLLLFAAAMWRVALDPAAAVLVPGTVPVVAGLVAYAVQLATRLVLRTRQQRTATRRPGATKVIVLGAGTGGRLLVRSLVHDPGSPYLAVALLDDDRRRRRARIEGLRVRGTSADMAAVAQATGAQHVVIAIPGATSATIRQLRAAAEAAGLHPLVVPPIAEVLGRGLTAGDIRDIDLADLLGRGPITLDEQAIGAHLAGRVVLVTGAGGSIGSELCRQIARYGPGRLVLLDRDESALHAVQLDLDGHGLLQSDRIVLADIRDPATLHARFAEQRPDVVFHAAALKHLPLLERYPLEAWQTNVLGTLNVLTAAASVAVDTFVNISTDKAADPTSVLGHSKRVAERLTAAFAEQHPGRWISVRFGNVLGSRGSVVPAFTAQIRRGGPLTVTHPEVRRFFMLIPEACQLVMQAAAMGRSGEVMVLDMGEQVRIVDLARTLLELSGRTDVRLEFTGLRPGEKLAEDLFSDADELRSTGHPRVMAVDVPALGSDVVLGAALVGHRVAEVMRSLATESVDAEWAAWAGSGSVDPGQGHSPDPGHDLRMSP